MEHFKNPRNMGEMKDADAVGEYGNPICGDLMHIYIKVKEMNGQKIIDNQPVKGVTGGAMTADESIPGPIYLQGDHGKVSYRNIVLTPILD